MVRRKGGRVHRYWHNPKSTVGKYRSDMGRPHSRQQCHKRPATCLGACASQSYTLLFHRHLEYQHNTSNPPVDNVIRTSEQPKTPYTPDLASSAILFAEISLPNPSFFASTLISLALALNPPLSGPKATETILSSRHCGVQSGLVARQPQRPTRDCSASCA